MEGLLVCGALGHALHPVNGASELLCDSERTWPRPGHAALPPSPRGASMGLTQVIRTRSQALRPPGGSWREGRRP